LESNEIGSPVLLADFGLSVYCTAPLDVPVGTPGYVAPEVVECLDIPGCTYSKEIDLWAVGVIMYILLCGFPPFYADDDDDVFDQILEGEYDYPSPIWDSVSDSAKDLIDRLLVTNPKKRITAKEALDHPWLQGENVSAKPLVATQDELKKFNAKRKWKAMILSTIAINKLTSKAMRLAANSSWQDLSTESS